MAQLLPELFLNPHEPVDDLDHVDGNADCAGLVRQCTSDRLTNPPRCIGGELVTSAILEFLDTFHQTGVAFLNKIQERKPTVCVFFCDGNHQAKIGFNHFRFRLMRPGGSASQLSIQCEVFFTGHANEVLQCINLSSLGLQPGFLVSRFPVPLQLIDCPETCLKLVMNILRHQSHFFDNLLFVKKLRE